MLVAGPFASCLAQTPILNSCSGMSLGPNGALNGFVPAPGDAWHMDISGAPLDPKSATIIATSGDLAGAHLHPDFGSGAYGYFGIPYDVVDSTQTPSVPVGITLYAADSDITVAPIPANAPVEGGAGACPASGGDRHMIVLDRNKCVAYEYWQAGLCKSAWTASNTALFDLSVTEKRPYGLTSADAAGLSIFEGLVRYDEIVAGNINHALRFTAVHTFKDSALGTFAAPATHAAGTSTTTHNVIGMRIRLRADFDVSGYSVTNRIILNAMKKYGMILADNGSNLFFQGTPDTRWDDDDLNKLKAVPSTAFEVVNMGTVYNTATAPKGAAPQIVSFTASSNNVAAGSPVTLTANVTGGTYSYIDNAGFYRAPVVVKPTVTTTYTLTSRNQFGTTTASTKVIVGAGGALPVPALTLAYASVGAAAAHQFSISESSPSAGAVTYTVASGPGTLSGNLLTISTPGTVVVRAQQAATATYAAATATVSVTLSGSGTPPATLPAPALKLYQSAAGGGHYWLSASTPSTGVITYSVVSGRATANGRYVTLTGAGTAVVKAQQAATSTYGAGSTTISITWNGK
jgi:hypothetical protein